MGFLDLLGRTDPVIRKHLGEPVIYSPGIGDPVVVEGIYDAAFLVVEPSGTATASSCAPAVFLSLSDLPSDPMTDNRARVTVRGVKYQIFDPRKDGQGAVVLILQRG